MSGGGIFLLVIVVRFENPQFGLLGAQYTTPRLFAPSNVRLL